MKHVAWSEVLVDSPIHFIIIDYGIHVFTWVGPESDMHSLHVAVPAEGMPPVSTLLSSSDGDGGSAVARRLSILTHRPVAVSWNLFGDPILQAHAEKLLATKVKEVCNET
eukprot:jgi/Ulvmu1/3886/UM018_0107.1